MGEQDDGDRSAKRPRISERTLLACISCKQRKLKVGTPVPRWLSDVAID